MVLFFHVSSFAGSEDCDVLHAGVDEMRKNTNPFTGGINFDAPWSGKNKAGRRNCACASQMDRRSPRRRNFQTFGDHEGY